MYGFVDAEDHCGNVDPKYCSKDVTVTIGKCVSNHPTSSKDGREGDCGVFEESSGVLDLYIDSKEAKASKSSSPTHRLYTLDVLLTDDCENTSTSKVEFLVRNPKVKDQTRRGLRPKSSKSSSTSDWNEWTLSGCDQYLDIEEEMMHTIERSSSSKTSKSSSF